MERDFDEAWLDDEIDDDFFFWDKEDLEEFFYGLDIEGE